MGELNTDALLIAGRGNVLTGVVGAAVPSYASIVTYAGDFLTPPAGFSTIGHTDPDELPQWDSDGEDAEMRRTWEMDNVREARAAASAEWFIVRALQFDNTTLSLYEGGGDTTQPHVLAAPALKADVYRSALVVYIDGANVLGYYCPKVGIRKDSTPEHSIDDWSKLPLRFTELSHVGMRPHYWIGEHLGTNP